MIGALSWVAIHPNGWTSGWYWILPNIPFCWMFPKAKVNRNTSLMSPPDLGISIADCGMAFRCNGHSSGSWPGQGHDGETRYPKQKAFKKPVDWCTAVPGIGTQSENLRDSILRRQRNTMKTYENMVCTKEGLTSLPGSLQSGKEHGPKAMAQSFLMWTLYLLPMKMIVLVMMEMAEMVVHDHDVHGFGS